MENVYSIAHKKQLKWKQLKCETVKDFFLLF